MTKNSNLMILDNSGTDYPPMLPFVFGFLVYWKMEPNSSAIPGLLRVYKAVTSLL